MLFYSSLFTLKLRNAGNSEFKVFSYLFIKSQSNKHSYNKKQTKKTPTIEEKVKK